jgi:hypothetical protein
MSSSESSSLDRAVLALLRPLVRLLLTRGVAFGQFAELAKQSYVAVVRKDFGVDGRKMSVSRVSILTGLTRKESKRLLEDGPSSNSGDPRRRINRAARVVSAWVRDPAYHDRRGAPVSLEFDRASGPSFTALVEAHGGDVGPRAVLDELVRVGAVESLRNGRLRLVERAYVPKTDEAEKLAILGTDVADLISTIDHNLDSDREGAFFQRKVAYDNLPENFLPALRHLVESDAQSLLERINDRMANHDLDVHPDDDVKGGHRAMVGIYYYEEESDDDD